MSVDLLRNAGNITRIGGPQELIIAPPDGRPMPAAMLEFLGYLKNYYLTTRKDRETAKKGEIPHRRPGQRFDMAAWLRRSAILLKWAQAGLSARGKDRVDLVNRYIMRRDAGPGWIEGGINLDALREWTQPGPHSCGDIWSKDTASLLTSLFIPRGLDALDVAYQRAHLRGLRLWAEDFFRPLLGDRFPFRFFGFFLDFSHHSKDEIRKLTGKLQKLTDLSQEERFERLKVRLKPVIESVSDLLDDETDILSIGH